jgi:hypothetical protein
MPEILEVEFDLVGPVCGPVIVECPAFVFRRAAAGRQFQGAAAIIHASRSSWRRRPGKSQRLAEKVAETRAKGEQSAMMMTLVSSARRHDLDVGVYVKDMLEQLLAGSTDYDRRSGVRGNGWGRQQNHEYCER